MPASINQNHKNLTKQVTLIILIYLSIINCKSQEIEAGFIFDDKGIYVEKFDSLNQDENRFTSNNNIFTSGKRFIYDYYYQDKSGEKYYFAKDSVSKENNWKLVLTELETQNSINKVILTISYGLSPFISFLPDYNQTVIKYDYKLINGDFLDNEMTGVIENERNIWLHPPRTAYFKILEINPFPYIKKPFEIGNKWEWNLRIGSSWSNKRWLLWEGNIENRYIYEITNKVILKTKLGDLECFEISSQAKSSIWETELISYFNENFGFIKLIYTNCDSSKITLELEKIENE